MKIRRETAAALCFLLPSILGFALFTLWPVVATFLLSFTHWDILTPPQWAGWENFTALLGFHRNPRGWEANDPDFWAYLGNTLFLLLALPATMAGSLALALLLNRKLRFIHGYRLIFFLPSILSGVAIFYLWKWIYHPNYGMANALLAHAGIHGPKWLADTAWAKPSLIIMNVWLAAGGQGMLIYLAALQGVSSELLDAAKIDGANAWHRLRAVIWPSLAPVTFFIFVMGVIHGLQGGVEAAYVMTQGGPNGATTTLGYYIYQKAYEQFQMGYAAAIAWTLFVLVLAITLLNWRFGKKEAL
ncbi:MAG: carbohydrate ABC transporter permease [Chthoniobacteraceae bacterium]